MAGLKEFHSFVGKFVSLWQNGIEASLHVDSKAGEATVSLQVGLGQALPLQQHQPLPKLQPSRLRRRQRRAEARKVAEQVAKTDAFAEEAGRGVDSAEQEASKSSTVDKTVKVPEKEETEVTEKGTQNVVEKASKDAAAPEMVATASVIVDDEFCSNDSYSDKPAPTTSPGAAPAPTSPPPRGPRGLGGFDYYSMTYEDPSDYELSD